MDLKLEQHIYVEYYFKRGYTARDTFKLLQKAYGCECLQHTMILEWFGQFYDGPVSVDDPKDGRSHTSRMTENIDAVCMALVRDRCMSRMLAECFHIDKETVRMIITADLRKKNGVRVSFRMH